MSESVAQTARIDSLAEEHLIPPAAGGCWRDFATDDPNPPVNIGVIDKDDAVVLPSIELGEEFTLCRTYRHCLFSPLRTGLMPLRIDTPTPAEFVELQNGIAPANSAAE